MTWKKYFVPVLQLSGVVLQLVATVPLLAQAVEILPVSTARSASRTIEAPLIQTSSNLVLVPVHVTKRSGTAINQLNQTAFTVLENNVPQNIVSFGNEDTPCSVGIILDLSGSMSNKLRAASSALRSFLETANPQDEAFLLAVSTKPESISPFTSDFSFLQNRFATTVPGGATALIDTIDLAMNRMRGAQHNNKGIVVISDGIDNHSRHSESELMRRVEEADVQVYTIGIQNLAPAEKAKELAEDQNGQSFLRTLSERSGGLYRKIRSFTDAPQAAAELSQAIRDQYLIGYYTAGASDAGRWRAIKVTVNLPDARVAARTGYHSR